MKWDTPTLNRTAITVTFEPKFLEWVKQLPDSDDIEFTLEMLNRDKPTYLVPDYEDEEEVEEWLIPMQDVILGELFESICTDPLQWPKSRKLKDFCSIEFHSQVFDLVADKPLKKIK